MYWLKLSSNYLASRLHVNFAWKKKVQGHFLLLLLSLAFPEKFKCTTKVFSGKKPVA